MKKRFFLLLGSVFLLASCAYFVSYRAHPALKIFGEFQDVEERNYVIPYSLNWRALYLLDNGKEEAVKNYLRWYLSHLNYPDKHGLTGTIYDYRIGFNGRERSTGGYDSVDGYAGTFLLLVQKYYQRTKDREFFEENRAKIEDVAYTIVYLQDRDGLIKALPGKKAKYLMDNCEAFGGLNAFLALSQEMGWEATKGFYEKAAKSLRDSIWKNFYDRGNNNFYWAIDKTVRHKSQWKRFYPDAYAQLFPLCFGLLDGKEAVKDSLWENFNRFHRKRLGRLSVEQQIVFKLAKKYYGK